MFFFAESGKHSVFHLLCISLCSLCLCGYGLLIVNNAG
jgi:hypothetical protein